MTHDQLLARVADVVETRYVLPDVGARAAAALRTRTTTGRYADVAGEAALAAAVTADLQDDTHDLHLRLAHDPLGARDEDDEQGWQERWAHESRRTAGGVAGVRREEDGIAVLELGPVLCPPDLAAPELRAAVALVAGAPALVIDLRGCRGGSPEAAALLLGGLLGDEPTHLLDLESRTETGAVDRSESWSRPDEHPVRLSPDAPVAVLTSSATFSGGEEVAFDLQELGRAVVVGEQTRGGAHPRTSVRVTDHLEVHVPVARAVWPRTGTNWEGVGIRPDVAVPAEAALDAALDHLRGHPALA